MTTIINTPSAADRSESSVAAIIGALLLVAGTILFVVYGLPALRGTTDAPPAQNDSIDVNVQLPAAQPATDTTTP